VKLEPLLLGGRIPGMNVCTAPPEGMKRTFPRGGASVNVQIGIKRYFAG
jgi:hypothetical protein